MEYLPEMNLKGHQALRPLPVDKVLEVAIASLRGAGLRIARASSIAMSSHTMCCSPMTGASSPTSACAAAGEAGTDGGGKVLARRITSRPSRQG